jgi:Ser/Thr protein kinase RdoA (MazF antagonist)
MGRFPNSYPPIVVTGSNGLLIGAGYPDHHSPDRVIGSGGRDVTAHLSGLTRLLTEHYGLHEVGLTDLEIPVNDVVAVSAAEGEFALKVYHRKRTLQAVQWEVDLLLHLHRDGAPVVPPIRGRNGYLEEFLVDGQPRAAVLFGWAPGAKPRPGYETYVALGDSAARIHRAADGFAASPMRETYDTAVLVDDQLRRMRPALVMSGQWRTVTALGERLKGRLAEPSLDWGICHMDLTLDNVHVAEGLMVFDFDSAGACWRAVEPYGVMRFSESYFRAWLTGYRAVRPFTIADETAVAVFGIVADLRVVAWKLGVAESSRGAPMLTAEDLPSIVDGWLDWEATHLVG